MGKTIGILGGMGPEAGCTFYQRIIEATPAGTDQEHPRTILYSQTEVPDRAAYLLGKGRSPIPALLTAVGQLESWGADFIAIPCNTAHCFYSEMQDAVSIPILHIARETASALAGEVDSAIPVAVLATTATVELKLYDEALGARGFATLLPTADDQQTIQRCIRQIKAGKNRDSTPADVRGVVRRLERRGAKAIVLGCTELGLVLRQGQTREPIFDSLDALARACVREALGPGVQKPASPETRAPIPSPESLEPSERSG